MPRSGRFTPRKDPVPIVQEAGWSPGPVWTGAENLAPPPGFDPRTVQPVASRYTDWAIPEFVNIPAWILLTAPLKFWSLFVTRSKHTAPPITKAGCLWPERNETQQQTTLCG